MASGGWTATGGGGDMGPQGKDTPRGCFVSTRPSDPSPPPASGTRSLEFNGIQPTVLVIVLELSRV